VKWTASLPLGLVFVDDKRVVVRLSVVGDYEFVRSEATICTVQIRPAMYSLRSATTGVIATVRPVRSREFEEALQQAEWDLHNDMR
jgi:hypothetical protein